jgi:iron complex outermembrane receptor protein
MTWLLTFSWVLAGPDHTARPFRVPAGPASETLTLFAQQAQREILFPSEPVGDVRTPRLFGDYPPRDALDRLLAGTRLRALEAAETGGFVISPATVPPNNATDAPLSPKPMKPKDRKSPIAAIAGWFAFGTATAMPAQTPPLGRAADTAPEQAILLSAFEVASTRDSGYRATNSVSGTRVNARLMDVPQTISVLTSDFIQDLGATDLDEALVNASGVGTAGFFSGQYTIRGFQTGTPRRNGISFTTSNAIDASVVDRVEVVKGPSSALYGTGGPGGVVNIVTKQPQAKRATAIETSVDSEGSLRGELDLTGPLTREGTLLYRMIVSGQRYESTRQFGERESWYLAPSLRWNIRRKPYPTTLNVTTEWLHVPSMTSSDERFPQVIESRPAPLGSNTTRMRDIATGYVPGLPRDFSIAGPNAHRTDDEVYFEATFTHAFNDHLSARVVYSDAVRHQVRFTQFANGQLKRDAAGNLPLTVPIQSWHSDSDNWNRTVRGDLSYAQNFSGVKLNLVAGAQDTAASGTQSVFRNLRRPDFNLFAPTAADYNLGSFPGDYSHLVHQRTASLGRQINAIANVQLFGERLSLIGAANRDFARSGILIAPDLRAPNAPGAQGPSVTVTPRASFDSLQGGFAFRVLPGANVFYSYSESITSNAPQFPNDPQEGTGHEAGLRVETLGGRFSGSISFFNVERTNIPRTDPNLPVPISRLSGKESSKGFEIDMFYFPTDALQLVANYTDMEPVVVSNTAAPVTQGSLTDAAFPRSFNAFAKYTFKQGPARGLYVTLGLNHRSRMRPYGTLENLYLLEHPAYTVVNGSLGYTWKRGAQDWHASLALKNATDKLYYTDTSIPADSRVGVFSVGVKF